MFSSRTKTPVVLSSETKKVYLKMDQEFIEISKNIPQQQPQSSLDESQRISEPDNSSSIMKSPYNQK